MKILMRRYELYYILTFMRHSSAASGFFEQASLAEKVKAVDGRLGDSLFNVIPFPEAFGTPQLQASSAYYCARDNTPFPPAEWIDLQKEAPGAASTSLRYLVLPDDSQPSFYLFRTAAKLKAGAWNYENGHALLRAANRAGAADLAETLGTEYWKVVLIDYVAVFLNLVFAFCLLYVCEKRREKQESGDGKKLAAGTGRAAADAAAAQEEAKAKQMQMQMQNNGKMIKDENQKDVLVHQDHLQELPAALEVRNLVKTFDRGRKIANNDVTYSVKRGEIFGLLGHNGAGKTTMLSQITCLIPTTSGDIVVDGKSVKADVAAVRQRIAFCPQVNPMWDAYTLRQHVEFFAALRNLPPAQTQRTLAKYATMLGLDKKLNTNCEKLSGGQKRRLWVMCALLGSAPLVLLDEATSGMDPQARRDFWVLLKKIAKEENRAIVFSTHYLEEADLLAERKLILAAGRVMALGTSPELKRQWGCGYWVLGMVDKTQVKDSETAKSILQGFVPVIQNALEAAEIKTEVKTKNEKMSAFFLAYSIPWAQAPKMPAVLEALAKAAAAGGHESAVTFTVEQTTMEEVFSLAGEKGELENLSVEERNQLEAARREREKDKEISRQPLLPRQLNFWPQTRAIFQFRLREESARNLGGYLSAVLFLGFWYTFAGLLKFMVDEDDSSSSSDAGEDVDLLPPLKPKQSTFGMVLNFAGGILLPFAFLFFGFNMAKNAYSPEKQLGLARHLSMHGVKRSAYHAGSALYFLCTLTGPCYVALAVSFWTLIDAVYAANTGIILAFVFHALIPTVISTVLVPLYLASTCSPGFLIFYQMMVFQAGFLKQVLEGVLTDTFSLASLADRLEGGEEFRKSQAALCTTFSNQYTSGSGLPDQATKFGFPTSWPLFFLFLGILFPNVAFENSVLGLQKLWGLDQTVTINERQTKDAIYAIWGAFEFMLNQVGFEMATLLDILYPNGTAGQEQQLSTSSTSFGLSFYLFGVLPENVRLLSVNPAFWEEPVQVFEKLQSESYKPTLEELVHETPLSDHPAQCGAPYFATVLHAEVLQPLYCLVFYSLLFLLYELWYLPNKMVGLQYQSVAELERACGEKVPPQEPDAQRDQDVVAEEKMTKQERDSEDFALDVTSVYKQFRDQTSSKLNWATNGVTLRVKEGECFGLLGPNGAGKTTLFSLISGNDDIGGADLGTISILRKDTSTDGFASANQVTGLAPQFDKLWPHVSGRAHLRLFAKCTGFYYPPAKEDHLVRTPVENKKENHGDQIKGEQEKNSSVENNVDQGRTSSNPLWKQVSPLHDFGEARISRLLREVSLSEKDADRPAEEYSGGMKRKLSVAMTMITDPSIVFLDEMSAGVDIVAQRSLWDKLINRPKNQTIISTTHSMMEADATSERIGILVGGRLKCLGSTSRIKSLYGDGYHLELILDLSGGTAAAARIFPAAPGDEVANAGKKPSTSGTRVSKKSQLYPEQVSSHHHLLAAQHHEPGTRTTEQVADYPQVLAQVAHKEPGTRTTEQLSAGEIAAHNAIDAAARELAASGNSKLLKSTTSSVGSNVGTTASTMGGKKAAGPGHRPEGESQVQQGELQAEAEEIDPMDELESLLRPSPVLEEGNDVAETGSMKLQSQQSGLLSSMGTASLTPLQVTNASFLKSGNRKSRDSDAADDKTFLNVGIESVQVATVDPVLHLDESGHSNAISERSSRNSTAAAAKNVRTSAAEAASDSSTAIGEVLAPPTADVDEAKNETKPAGGAEVEVLSFDQQVKLSKSEHGKVTSAKGKPLATMTMEDCECFVVDSLLAECADLSLAREDIRLLEKVPFSDIRVRLIFTLGGGGKKPHLASVFRWCLENSMKKYIEDYGFGEPTLEQVFLKFAREQELLDAKRTGDAEGRKE
ncbi:unnamed protein product [Amoebophrya sp. A120]|nr:unnamed protein product [Amoebophrya sp. A120]|eukprot:GSA120T00012584001.1